MEKKPPQPLPSAPTAASASQEVVEPREVPFQPASQLASQPASQAPSGPASQAPSLSVSQRKRKIDEVADSQDEDEDSDGDYGWAEGDDALLENPAEKH